MAERGFVDLSDAGDSRENGVSDCRSSCTIRGFCEDHDNGYTDAQWVAAPKEKVVFDIEPFFPLEDMPWTGSVPLVSDRFKKFIEAEAPDHAQFFEAELVLPTKPIDPSDKKYMLPKAKRLYKKLYPNGFDPEVLRPMQPYYIVNWLHSVDCIDLERTFELDRAGVLEEHLAEWNETYLNSYTYDDIDTGVMVLDVSRVPKDVMIFRLVHQMETVCIDSRLARMMLDAGLTGAQFYSIGKDYPPDWPWGT